MPRAAARVVDNPCRSGAPSSQLGLPPAGQSVGKLWHKKTFPPEGWDRMFFLSKDFFRPFYSFCSLFHILFCLLSSFW